jgi:hypothetical protein
MKIILTLMMCSYLTGNCMPPHNWPETFDTDYDCSVFGYEESLNKLKEIGKEKVNELKISITFTCTLYAEEGSET